MVLVHREVTRREVVVHREVVGCSVGGPRFYRQRKHSGSERIHVHSLPLASRSQGLRVPVGGNRASQQTGMYTAIARLASL